MLLLPRRIPSSLIATFWILLLGLGCSGCGPKTGRVGDEMLYLLESKAGNVSLTLDELTIEFEGLDGPNEMIQTGVFYISGDTPAQHHPGSWHVSLSGSYRDGVADIAVAGYKFQVVEAGTKLIYSGQTYPIADGLKTLRIAKDGTAHLLGDAR
jgi:hypothetical protein